MAKSKLGDLFFEVGYKLDDKGLKKAEKALDNLGLEVVKSSKKTDLLNTGLSNIATKAAGILSIGYAFKKTSDYIVSATTTYAEFDDSLRKTTSKLGLDDTGLKVLADSTKKVALEYRTTAKEVSDAQEYLALAGYTLEEIQAASPMVIAAQKATGESMQLVSDIATDTASSYGFLANQLDFVTDRMVYTTTKFNTNFAQLGEAMKYVAPIAKQAGMNFADLNAYIGVLANSGIKGSQAGTSLRMAFLRLQAPTKSAENLLKKYNVRLYKANGEFIGINNAMYRVEKATKKMSEQQKAFFLQQLFGAEAMSAINILFDEGIKKVAEYGDNVEDSTGKTKEMARTMDAGLGGMFRAFEIEKAGLKVVVGEIFEPVAYDFIKILKDGLSDVREDLEENKDEISDFTTGLWSYTKKTGAAAGTIVNSFVNETGNILDFLSGGLFKTIPMLGIAAGANNIAEEGKNVRAEQSLEKQRYAKSYDNISLIDTSSEELEKYLENMYDFNQRKEEILKNSILKTKLNLGNTIDKNKISLTIKEPPKVEISINGGIFTSDESINNLANLLSDRINDNFSNNWDAKLKFESSLIGGNQ